MDMIPGLTISKPRRGSDLSFESSFGVAPETVPVERQSNSVPRFFLVVPDRSQQADVTVFPTTTFFSCATAAVDPAIPIAGQIIVNLIEFPSSAPAKAWSIDASDSSRASPVGAASGFVRL
ncbi:hypothetical protein [Mesorhizobium sp.]|uniref:hypothetical protein n=1 Tax=Mesorhizobium sp. TaxID=1871066 RepID=UPI000FE6ABD0|nr:hypothetical protein [Mesorhizobium sp.]RWE86987.1 MAG: hypothetical protein EOS49_12090 [Mesorhizobium sp.]TIS65735.1 MAG: hypothetical protein E5W92_17510 [Mesorhizobium sp.]